MVFGSEPDHPRCWSTSLSSRMSGGDLTTAAAANDEGSS